MAGIYFKLARWDDRLATFREVKVGFTSERDARAAAKTPGRYRISTATSDGWADVATFDVGGPAAEADKPKRASGLRSKPGAWRGIR